MKNVSYDETTLFWQHLTLAGLVPGSYGGATDGAGYFIPGTDVPLPKLNGGCYDVNYSGVSYLRDSPWVALNAHFFGLGSYRASNGTGVTVDSCAEGLVSLTAAAGFYLDQKVDDGKPFSGSVQTTLFVYGGNYNYSGNTYPGCTNENYGVPPLAGAIYAISAPVTACQLFFRAAF